MQIVCPQCGCATEKASGVVNRSRKQGAPIYCGRACAGLARRLSRSADERKALKADYDRRRREALGDGLRESKRAAYRARLENDLERLREEQREQRRRRMPKHVEYCRRPEYRASKREYDRKHRAQQDFGPFAEAALILGDLDAEIATRASRYEIYSANGTLNKALRRKREYAKAFGC